MESEVIIKTNEFQTPVTKEWLESYPSEVQEQFLDFIDNVPLIKWMIGERPRAKDLPRDEEGKIIVDITHPHILEDMDYFRPAALFYEKNGCYSLLKPNSNPNSEYGKWFLEEVRRCREGYIRESDGEWITGQMYFFLNYSRIMLTRRSANSKVAKRVEGFPDVWEGIYYRFHYLDQARKAGKHCVELARRGCGKSFTLASMMAHNLILGENEEVKRRVTTVLTAYLKEYLAEKDGTLSKFTPMIDFVASNTEFPRLMYKRSQAEMTWIMGYKNSNGNINGSLNTVLGLSVKDDEGKVRGKRGFIFFEEMGSYKNFRGVWDNVRDSVKDGEEVFSLLYAVGTAGDSESDFSGVKTILYNPNSYEVLALDNVYDKKGKGTDKFAYFFPSYMSRTGCMDHNGNSDVTRALMSILMMRWDVKQGGDSSSYLSRVAQMPITPAEAILKVKSNYFPVVMLNERIRQLDTNPHSYDDVYVGTLVDVGGRVEFRSTNDTPIRKWPVDNTEEGALEIYSMPPPGENLHRYIIGCLTPGQLVTTDSGLKKVEDVGLNDKLLNKDGEYVSINNLQRRCKVDEPVYNIKLWDNINGVELTGNHPVYAATPRKRWHSWKTHMKTGAPAMYYEYDFDFRRADELNVGDVVKSPVPYFEEKRIPYEKWTREPRKGLKLIDNPLAKWKFWWLMGLILGDGWCDKYNVHVVFNKSETQYISRFKNVVEEVFGRSVVLSHDRANCIEYQFSSSQCCSFFTENFGKYSQNKYIAEWIKFLPKPLRLAIITGYLDSDGCCRKNCMEFVSTSERLLLDFQDIFLSLGIVSGVKKLRDAGIHNIVGRQCRTNKTYSLAIAREGVIRINSLLGGKDLKLSKFDNRTSVVRANTRCWLSEDGRYVFYKIRSIDRRNYTGVVYNFECDTHTYMCHHLPVHNCDPINQDQAESRSLFSFFVFDLVTDDIVAEYTGRKRLAEEAFELVRLAAIFWNASVMYESNSKMMFAYFAKMRCTWMLADCPEYLRARGVIKYNLFGSSAKGISSGTGTIMTANEQIKDWLMKTYPVEVTDERGEPHIEQVPQLYRLRCRALLDELVGYGPEVNTDRVSALQQTMMYREHFIILYGGSPNNGVEEKDDSDDEFFDKDWNHRLQQLGPQYKSSLDS